MTVKSVFEFRDYKLFLAHIEDFRKAFERGFRSRLADFLGCQSAYISHVLNGSAHLSLEQGLQTTKFLNLNPREQRYFISLIEHARAGTSDLKAYFDSELNKILEEHLNIKERVGAKAELSESEQSIYYSSWHYLAVHVLVSLPEYNDAKSISQALHIPEEIVNRVLLFLTQTNMIKNEKGKLKPGATQVHLNRESPLIFQHHTNCRIAAIQTFANNKKSDLHYSTVSSLSKSDADRLRLEMVKLIERYVGIVAPSKEEVMYGFNMDFYSLCEN